MASVIAEHGLTGGVIGAAFDGTGYGDDGTVWGSEFFLCRDDKDYKRIAHLKPVKLIGGDEGARNCQVIICAYMAQAGMTGNDDIFKTVAAALAKDINTVTSTSMGNEGKMVCVVAEKDADEALDIIKSSDYGASACFIGKVVEGEGGKLILNTKIGGHRVLDVLQGEGLPRIC